MDANDPPELPVRQLDLWSAVSTDFTGAVSFLSGDNWQLEISDSAEAVSPPTEVAPAVDAVCLFSGGLDSFTGALNLLAEGKTVCLVGHYGPGQTHQAQQGLCQALARRYPDQVVARWFFLQPAAAAAGQARPLPAGRESSQRSRSLLFIAAGLTVAAGYEPEVPLYIPENGLIGINVPLTGARKGSFSTRTTHPYFMDKLSSCVRGLGIANPIVNPFRLMTKGEILAACARPANAPAASGCDAVMRAPGNGSLGEGRTDELRILLPVPHPACLDAPRRARPARPVHVRRARR